MGKGKRTWEFIFILVLGWLCMVANEALSPSVGGTKDLPSLEQDKEIREMANYAVNEYNKENNAALCLSKVVKAQKQVVVGTKYYLTLQAFNDGKPRLYRAVIYVKPWQNYKELQEFTPLKE